MVINTRRNCKQHAYVLWISNMCVLFIHDAMFLLALWISCLVPAGAPVLGLNTTVAACCIVKSQCLWKSHIAGLEVPTSMLAATTPQDGPVAYSCTCAQRHVLTGYVHVKLHQQLDITSACPTYMCICTLCSVCTVNE